MSDYRIQGETGEWEVVVGLEVHAQVTSNAKLFSGAATAFGAHGARAFHGFADILDPGHDGRELHEFRVGAACDQPRERGLARARRPPEEQRHRLVRLDQPPQRRAGLQEVPLPDEVVETGRPHPHRQGR